ncbi:AzlD domain-containing protein, partial [Salipiger sp. HF18]
PTATGGETDPARLAAAAVALAVGYFARNPLLAMVVGAAVLVAGGYWAS